VAEPLIGCRAVTVAIGERILCKSLDLQIEGGQCWGVLGANGVGKSTLLHTLAGLIQPRSGVVELGGRPIATIGRREVARRVGLLPQNQSDPFPNTLLEMAMMGRHPHLGAWGSEGEEDLAIARAALATVGLAALEQRMVQTLSGGERRRLAIATLLTQNPQLMLLDEPVNHLDLHHQIALLTALRARCSGDRAAVMVLHDPSLAARFSTHLLLIFDDATVESGECSQLLDRERLARLYHHPVEPVATADGRVVWVAS
jgi:iron complex transport system ATP-binding protein